MYIVIETWPDAYSAAIVTDEDGNNMVFETEEQAQQEAADCQDGKVISI